MSDFNKFRLQLSFPYDKKRMFPLILSVLFMLPGLLTAQAVKQRPFNPGDHFNYDIKWGFIKVGEAEMLVEEPAEDELGELNFVLKIRTTSWADTFYRVRNEISSYTDAQVTHSVHYYKKQEEGSRKKDIVVDFDWDEKKVVYRNYDEAREPVDIIEGTQDPFSILFAYRMKEMIEGEVLNVPVTDGKKMISADIIVKNKEKIKTKAGRFDCIRVMPDIKDLGGVFSKSKDSHMELWFSDDEYKMIVKMTGKVSVGSFKIELRNYVLGKATEEL